MKIKYCIERIIIFYFISKKKSIQKILFAIQMLEQICKTHLTETDINMFKKAFRD